MSGQSANLSLKEAKAMQERICAKHGSGSSKMSSTKMGNMSKKEK